MKGGERETDRQRDLSESVGEIWLRERDGERKKERQTDKEIWVRAREIFDWQKEWMGIGEKDKKIINWETQKQNLI